MEDCSGVSCVGGNGVTPDMGTLVRPSYLVLGTSPAPRPALLHPRARVQARCLEPQEHVALWLGSRCFSRSFPLTIATRQTPHSCFLMPARAASGSRSPPRDSGAGVARPLPAFLLRWKMNKKPQQLSIYYRPASAALPWGGIPAPGLWALGHR